MAGGRPKRHNVETCPRCGKPGYSYQAPSWNGAYKDAPRNLYVRFIHQDRALPYCYIGKESKPEGDLQVAREYYRSKKEVRTYSFHNGGNFIIEKHESFKAIPIVIYCFYKPHAMTKKLKKSSLKLEEIEWLLKDSKLVDKYPYPMPRQFLTGIQSSILYPDPNTNVIVTFGESAVKESEKILDSGSFIGEITTLIDKYGLMTRIIKRRNLSIGRSFWFWH